MHLEPLCQQVIALAQETGQFLLEENRRFDRANIEYKGINNLVSYVDRESEKRLVEGLNKILPQAAFITEEDPNKQIKTSSEFHWIIDPLDGTTNFTHQLPVFSISIGLMQGDQVVLGVIVEVNRNECFSAWQGGGAYLNGKPIRVSPTPELQNSLLATGFPYRDFGKMHAYLDIIDELMRKTHGLRRMGSAAVDLAFVACGRFEGFFEYNLSPWDVAAGSLIVQEAGGQVSDFSLGNDFVFGRQIIAAGNIHAAMQSIIYKHWKIAENLQG